MKRERDDDENGPQKREDEDGGLHKHVKVEKGQSPHGRSQQAGQMDGHTHAARDYRPNVTNAYDYLSQVKQKCPPSVTSELFRVLKEYKSNRLDRREVIQAVSELLAGHEDLIDGFNSFLPSSEKIDKDRPSQDDDDEDDQEEDNDDDEQDEDDRQRGGGRGSLELANAKNFIEKAKLRFENQPDVYRTFISLLREFHEKRGVMTIKILYKKIVALFEGHPDLIAGIQSFLPESVESSSDAEEGRSRQKTRKQKGGRKGSRAAPKREKEKEKVNDWHIRLAPLVIEKTRPPNRPGQFQEEDLNLFFLIKKRLDNNRYFKDFLKCLNLYTTNILSRVQLMLLVFDILGKYPDLLQRFKGFMRLSVHEEKELMEELRELCDSDREMSEEKRKRRIDNLCFELNILIAETASSIKQLVQTLNEMSELSNEALMIVTFNVARLDDACRRTIERLYGDRTQDVLQAIYGNPTVTIPVVIKRMKQKEVEWRGLRLKYLPESENSEGQNITNIVNAIAHQNAVEGKAAQLKEEANGDSVNKQESIGNGEAAHVVETEAMETGEPPRGTMFAAAAETPCTEEKGEWEKVRNGEREEPGVVNMEVDQRDAEDHATVDTRKPELKEEEEGDQRAGGVATSVNGIKEEAGDERMDAAAEGEATAAHSKEGGNQGEEGAGSGSVDSNSIANYHNADDHKDSSAESRVVTNMLC